MFFLLLSSFLIGTAPIDALFQDLQVVEEIDQQQRKKLPFLVNQQLQGGYFAMPSARMAAEGVVGVGESFVPPYWVTSLLIQPFSKVEATMNYWIYRGQLEGNMGHLGFGDDADRAANLKIALLSEQDQFPFLPLFAVGLNDFLGSSRFFSYYFVATKQWKEEGVEATFGWGDGRIGGFFGALAYTPFAWSPTLIVEYDANRYKTHFFEHPKGRTSKSPLNVGLQFAPFPCLRLGVSSVRGEKIGGQASFSYNLGETKGFFPKIYDAPLYKRPVNRHALSAIRSEKELAAELSFAMKQQGFDLYDIVLCPEGKGKKRLWIKVVNLRYREEEEVRSRLMNLLGRLTPQSIEGVDVAVEADGILEHAYRFRTADLFSFTQSRRGVEEMRVLSPLEEPFSPGRYEAVSLFHRKKPIAIFTFRPDLTSYFGSHTGKFKYQTGAILGVEGFVGNFLLYTMSGNYVFFSNAGKRRCVEDLLNPSKLLQVRSDTGLYQQTTSFHLDTCYMQKSWNLKKGCFTRCAVGYFEPAYAGLAFEALHYPVGSSFAIGCEAAVVWKRRYEGLLFQKVRKEGKMLPFTGYQYFLDFYYDHKKYQVDFKASMGQFLARDLGIRLDAGKLFTSGFRAGVWWTFTNGGDRVNHHRYYDKGFILSIPLDFFLNQKSRTRVQFAMSAWLRDVGAKAATGKELYRTLYYERATGQTGLHR